MPTRTPCRHSELGLSLFELMLGLGLAALLIGAVLPSYQHQLQRSRRAEAITILQQAMLAQDRHKTRHGRYAASLDGLGLRLDLLRHYELSLEAIDADTGFESSYRLRARPLPGGPQARDHACQHLLLSVHPGHVEQHGEAADGRSSACWPT